MPGTLHIQRDVVAVGHMNWKYSVDVGEKTTGHLEEGAKDFNVAAGYQTLRLHTAILGSREVTFFVDEGARVCFLCMPRFTGPGRFYAQSSSFRRGGPHRSNYGSWIVRSCRPPSRRSLTRPRFAIRTACRFERGARR